MATIQSPFWGAPVASGVNGKYRLEIAVLNYLNGWGEMLEA